MQSQTDVADSDVEAAREPPLCAATLVVEGVAADVLERAI
jgi:hypothetical protein